MTTHTMAIYSNEHLHLARDLDVELLVVHLGRPGPTLNVGSHEFEYDAVDFVGEGQFRIMRDGITLKVLPRYTSRAITIIGHPAPLHLPAEPADLDTVVVDIE